MTINKKINQSNVSTRPIRVLHIIDKLGVGGSSVHGVTKALSWWIPRFDPSEFSISVCSLRGYERAGKVLEEKQIPVFYLNKSKFDPTTIISLLSLVKREQPDILHLHGYGATNFGRIVSAMSGVPNIVHEHVVIPKQPLYQTIADTVLSPLATKSVAISKPVREFMVQERKINPEKLETFFYGLPLAEFQVSKEADLPQKRESLGIKPDETVICSVGRLDTQKGQIYLLQAAVPVLKQSPQTRFLIIGDGPDLAMLKSVAEQSGISDKVIFAGYRQDIPDLLSISDIVALPSLWEGGPITVFEAMNLGKPVVGTPVGLMEEVIEEGVSGFIVPCKDSDLLAEKLSFLVTNLSQAKAMGQKGQEICQKYDISHSVKHLDRIYRELVA